MKQTFSLELLNAFQKHSNECYQVSSNGVKIDNLIIEDLKDYLNGSSYGDEDKNYECFKHIDDFFRLLPKNIWRDEALKLSSMIELLSFQKDTELYNKRTKSNRTKKGSLLKRDDLKNLENALPVLEKLYKIQLGNIIIEKESDIPNDRINELPPKYLNGIRAINLIKDTIKDINTGEYNQGFYYKQDKPSKEEIKKYLNNLNTEYNARGSHHIKSFLDKLKPYQYANLAYSEQ